MIFHRDPSTYPDAEPEAMLRNIPNKFSQAEPRGVIFAEETPIPPLGRRNETFCWKTADFFLKTADFFRGFKCFLKNAGKVLLLMAEILHQLIGSLTHYL